MVPTTITVEIKCRLLKVRKGGCIMLLEKLIRLLPVNLKLFDGEGGDAGAGSSTGSGTGEAQAGAIPTQGTAPGKKSDSKKPVVLYGKQPEMENQPEGIQQNNEVQTATAQAKTPEQLRTEYETLRKGEYKQFFDAEIQNIINKRFRETKTLESQLASINPIVELLSEKYGTDDINELASKLRQDSLQDLADSAGMTIEQYEQIMKIRQENKLLKEKQRTLEMEQKLNAQVQEWQQQAELLKNEYPQFDLREEIKNEQFMSLLKSGVKVREAYIVCHMNDIITGTAKQAQQNIVENIKAKGNRPQESAAKGMPGIIIKSDPRNLTREDRAEIAQRVMRGEEIKF